MNRMTGSHGEIKMDATGVGTTVMAVESMNAWALNMARAKTDVTAFQDVNLVYVQGLPDIKGTLGGWFDTDEFSIFDAAMGDIAVFLNLIPSTLSPTYFWKGPAWLDAAIDVKHNGGISMTSNFVAAGAWSRMPGGTLLMAPTSDDRAAKIAQLEAQLAAAKAAA